MKRVWGLTAGDQRGGILLSGLVLVMVMTILGVSLFDLSMIEGRLASGDAASNELLYCAEAALGRTMIDWSPGGRMTQISGLLNTAGPHTLTPTPETVTTATLTGTLTCTNTVTFTPIAPLPATSGYLQAVATAPNGTWRSVRVQLMPWFPGSTVTDTSDPCHNSAGGIACTATTPYFNHPSWDNGGVGVCSGIGCPNMNLGYYLTNTGAYPSVLTTQPINGHAGLAGPGVALPYWTNGGGTFDPNFFFKSNGGPVTVTFQWGDSAYVPGSGNPNSDTFGWFTTNSTGTSLTLHPPLFTANQSGFKPGNTYTFTPCPAPCATPQYYGFYLQNPTGIYPTLSSLGTDISDSDAPGNTIKPQPIDCGGGSCSPVPFQHAALFQQSPTTYWMGMEDWDNHAAGTNCLNNGTTGCSDHDYQDVIVKFVIPSSDTVVSRAGGGSFTGGGKNWKDWQECRGSGSPPSC